MRVGASAHNPRTLLCVSCLALREGEKKREKEKKIAVWEREAAELQNNHRRR